VQSGYRAMMLAGILRALRDLPAEVDDKVAARMGFLEWLMTLPEGCSEAAAARAAECRAAPLAATSPQVALFCNHLRALQRCSDEVRLLGRPGGGGA